MPLSAQDKPESQKKSDKVRASANKLEKAYEANNTKEIASSYEDLAENYEKDGDFKKAEEYYLKAKTIYSNIKDKKALSLVFRKIAQLQEKMANNQNARENYQNSAAISTDSIAVSLNKVDIKRLDDKLPPNEKEVIIESKINDLNLSKSSDGESLKTNEVTKEKELAEGFSQLADVQVKQNKIEPAIQNYQNAIANSQGNTLQIVALNNKITALHLKSNDIQRAVQQNMQLLKNKDISSDSKSKIEVIENISKIYLSQKEVNKSIEYLKESYQIALENGHTFKAQDLVSKLADLYSNHGKKSEVVPLYKNFIAKLNTVIEKDSSLWDKELIASTELKIQKLEAERALKDKLISTQNRINYFLIGGISILGVLFFLLYKAYKSMQLSNKKIELQALRKEMNPHFIFNSLNSVNQFISSNDERTANQYLSRFSSLMRTVMENSNNDFITLDKELKLIKNYVELEHQRFATVFDYKINVDENIETDQILVPNMVLQPHIENAIWHGLRYLEKRGNLEILFLQTAQNLVVEIDDNGIGIAKSTALKTFNQMEQKSIGTSNIKERIKLLNSLYHCNILCTTIEKENESGTRVTISIPLDLNIKKMEK